MAAAITPPDEQARLVALRELGVLDQPADQALEDLVHLTARMLEMPVSMVNFVDDDRQWTAAAKGIPQGTVAPRSISFCAHAIATPGEALIVEDAVLDERFHASPLVTMVGLRFYAGIPLCSEDGQGLGTLCVADRKPRHLDDRDLRALTVLAQAVTTHVRLRRENRRLSTLSTTDPLTGVSNRRALDAALESEVARAQRAGTSFSVVMLDLDHFKDYNDTHGHAGGDALLQIACASWARCLRLSDTLARYGGEEFVAVLPDADTAGAVETAERLRGALTDGATCSAGVATWEPGEDGAAVVARADAAMYAAKAAGRDRVHVAASPV